MIRFNVELAPHLQTGAVVFEGKQVVGLRLPIPAADVDSRQIRGYAPMQRGAATTEFDSEIYPVSPEGDISFPNGEPIPEGAEKYVRPKLEARIEGQLLRPYLGETALSSSAE